MSTNHTESLRPKSPVIRDKQFAKRLETACENNPHCPTVGRGKQKWIYDNLLDRFGISVSPEATRKWFAGESRPRPAVMSAIARLLEVDEAWLSLGITPDETPIEKQKRNAIADGAVNYLAGLIQMSGGHIAFPDASENEQLLQPDLYAIIKGKQYAIEVKRAHLAPTGELKLNIPTKAEKRVVIGIVDTISPLQFDLVRLPQDIIEKQGRARGGFTELVMHHTGSHYFAGDDVLPQIMAFDNLDGIIPRSKRPMHA